MPKFPTYRGELLKCLNPLNPRHYFLLLYWVFFRPTALKCYLYQADPKLYRTKMGKSIFRTWNVSAYRNLYVMVPGIVILLAVLLDLPFILLIRWFEGIPINWLNWTVGSTGGIVAGVGSGLVFAMMLCMMFDVAAGAALGVVFSVISGVAVSLWIGTTAGLADSVTATTGSSTSVGITVGVLIGLLTGLGIGIAFSKAFSVKIGVVFGGVSSVLVCGVIAWLIDVTASVATGIKFGVAFGIVGGMLASVLIGMEVGIGFSLLNGFSQGVGLSMVSGVISGVIFGITTGLAVFIGVLRIIFYPFQFVFALCSRFQRVRHPLEWDEMTILPLPRTWKVLMQKIQQDEREGLCHLADVGRNPFRQAVMQKVLYRHLHAHSYPLHFLYNLLIASDLKEYVITPVSSIQWKHGIPVHHLFLRELALRFAKTGWWRDIYHFFYWLTWWMSSPLREHRRSPLTNFAGMLYKLLDIEVVEAEEFTLSSYSEIYGKLSAYSGGVEISQTFDAMATFLAYNNLSNLPNASEITSNLTFDDPIRPTVLTALNRLGQVGAEITVYRDSSSRANQLAALARATDTLKNLNEYVQAEVMAPEWYFLRRVIRQWQALIIETGGELGRAEVIGPVANPYVAGNPVTGELFVGREDILRRLEELWRGAGQKPSVVLYWHRRMGKSSILQNLGARFGKDTVIVDFNMQRVGLVASTGELLYNLALAVYDVISPIPGPSQEGNTPPYPPQGGNKPTPGPSQEGNAGEAPALPGEPDEERFTAHNPYTAFDRFLKQVDRVRGERRFIITVDEFELIEQKIEEGKLEAQLLDFWRGVIQTYPWFVMAFAGLHTLQEMTQDYWHPLFGSVTGIPVSFLKVGAAKKLITQPTADFDLDYDADAIERIIELTYGQPYLVQLICHCLVTRFNRQSFEEGVERERRFSLVDVEAVINAPEFYRDGDAYFTGVWRQAETDEATGQQDILRVLAQSEAGKTIEELAQQSSLALEDVRQALEVLKRHDVVVESDGSWQFTVELMRRWVIGIERGPFDLAQDR